MMAVKELIDPQPIVNPISDAPWYVMLTEPQQDLTTVWRLHELGLEMFVPVLRIRVKTRRMGRNGHKVHRTIAKPMFPGYGFLRVGAPLASVLATRGVRGFMPNEQGHPIMLPHQAIMAVQEIQDVEHREKFMSKAPKTLWKRGDPVRIDEEGGVYAGLVGTVEWANSKGNIGILLGMIRHTLRSDMVVAA